MESFWRNVNSPVIGEILSSPYQLLEELNMKMQETNDRQEVELFETKGLEKTFVAGKKQIQTNSIAR